MVASFLFGSFLGGLLSSCNPYDKHEPVAPVETSLPEATLKIAEVQKKYVPGGFLFPKDIAPIIIRGQVISDDRLGNFYNEMFIQDSTGGIKISLGYASLYDIFPQGSEVAVTLNGLKLGSYKGTLSIGVEEKGTRENNRIPLPLVMKVVKGDAKVKPLEINEVSINDISTSMGGMLVKIKDVQFKSPEETWANPNSVNKFAENRELQDRDGNIITVRTSDYSVFAGKKLPNGSGDIVGVCTFFNETPQLYVSSPADAKFDKPRFEVGGNDKPAPSVTKTLSEIKALYMDKPVTLPDNTVFEAVVISSDKDGNFYRDLYMQDEQGHGISIKINRKKIYETYPIGTKLVVDASGLTLGRDNNRLSIGTAGSGNYQTAFVEWKDFTDKAFKTGTKEVAPKVITIAEITPEMCNTYIEIKGLTAVEGGQKKWVEGGMHTNSTFTDEGGNKIFVYSNKYVAYKDNLLPTGKVNIKGVLSGFNTTNQISLNSISDVVQQ